jgi:phosphoserine phosphatase
MEELGSGFYLAMHDLEIRGAGEVLGENQSGEMLEIGFQLYSDMLNEAVRRSRPARSRTWPRRWPPPPRSTCTCRRCCRPTSAATCTSACRSTSAWPTARCAGPSIDDMQEELIDRFGKLPDAVKALIETHRLRIAAKRSASSRSTRTAKRPTCSSWKSRRSIRSIITLIQKNRHIKLAGQDKLRITAACRTSAARVNQVKQTIKHYSLAGKEAMSKKLILQGPRPMQGVLAQIAALAIAAPRAPTIHAHALRCDGRRFSPALKPDRWKPPPSRARRRHLHRRRRSLADFRLVAMDMDSTLITIECIDEIADMQGLKPQVSEITEAAMRGELDFSESLKRRVALLEGLAGRAGARVRRAPAHVDGRRSDAQRRAGGRPEDPAGVGRLHLLHRAPEGRLGWTTARQRAGDRQDGKLTGRVVGGIVDAEEKMRTVQRVCAELRHRRRRRS